MSIALKDVKILNLSHIFPASYCTMLLSDLGADVIVVDPPGGSIYVLPGLDFTDRNSRSITLDLKSDKGKKICRQLAEQSDVLIEEFRPGLVKRLGLDYDSIKSINPDIIYCSISGYGQDGPYRDRPGHAISYEGTAGLFTFSPDVPILRGGLPVGDPATGMWTTIGILAALRARDKTGKGQYVDISMTDGLVSWATGFMGYQIATGLKPLDTGAGHLDPANCNVFETKGGKYITLSHANEESLWRSLCLALGRKDLADMPPSERRGRREKELTEVIRQILLTKTRDEWDPILSAGGVAWGPAYNLDEVTSDPQIKHRMVVEVNDPKKGKKQQIAFPIKFSETPAEIRSLPFTQGEHTDEILISLGYKPKEIEQLHKEAVVFGPQ
jgi:crotonobetainyl-CoA:carnitine CoA-transferase CaiB-like acyl-CoA transferase